MSLTGILLDVSGSMKTNIGSGTNEEGGPWARSIFKVVDDLIEHDVSSENSVFALGVGADCSSKEIFDVIGTVQKIEEKTPATVYHISAILSILERNGARNIRNWVTVERIRDEVTDFMASLILMKLGFDTTIVRKFVYEILPIARRNHSSLPLFSLVEDACSYGVSCFKQATKEDILEVVNKATNEYLNDERIKAHILEDVGTRSIFSVRDASRINRRTVDEKELSTERSRELLKTVEPFIYGGTPLYQALDKATKLFHNNNSKNKVLFVLSDGEPADGDIKDTRKLQQVVSKLNKAGVKIVSCFISKSTCIQPKRLYNEVLFNWELGAKFLFSLSSELSTQLLLRAILVKRGWDIDVANNETKLFIQVNHPDNLREACDVARDVVYCSEALSDLLVSVDFDIYINQSVGTFKAKEQIGGICYANASAVVLHLAMKRILGREGGYPDFHVLKDEMIQSFGSHGANTLRVLQTMCPKYRLHCDKVSVDKAMEAIVKKRPVIARFRLTDEEWDVFGNFFKHNPTAILTVNELDVGKRRPNTPTGGHAVVLTSFNSKYLTLMNSWGTQWADMGFFRVKSAAVLELEFIDVYWTLDDLREEEKEYYRKHGSEVARKLMASLKGLQKAKYACPKCKQSSVVTEFTGTLSQVKCPKCSQQFSANDNEGNILALNMYLTSLSR